MRKRIPLLVLIFVTTPLAVAHAGDIGDAGSLFLRVGMGARASGMGEAFVGVAEDASSIYWNPGAMSPVLGTNMLFMHNEYFQSIRLEQVALTHETNYGTFGLAFTGLYMDEMDRYEDVPSAIPLGTFSAYDVSFALAYSRYIIPNLSAGLAVKTVYQNIDESTAKGFAFDLGLYHVSRIEGVKFAAMLANVGSPIRFENDRFTGKDFDLPRSARLGASYERPIPSVRGDILATLDVVFPNDGNVKQHLGVEYGYRRVLYLRGGYKAGYDSQGPTFGAGVKYNQFFFDYAMLVISNDLGDSHRFSLAVRL